MRNEGENGGIKKKKDIKKRRTVRRSVGRRCREAKKKERDETDAENG